MAAAQGLDQSTTAAQVQDQGQAMAAGMKLEQDLVTAATPAVGLPLVLLLELAVVSLLVDLCACHFALCFANNGKIVRVLSLPILYCPFPKPIATVLYHLDSAQTRGVL